MLHRSINDTESQSGSTLDLLVFTFDQPRVNQWRPAEPSETTEESDVRSESAEPAPPSTVTQPETAGSSPSVALTILATLAVLYTIAAASAILFPITLAALLALTLRPVVRYGERWHIAPLVTSIGILLVTILIAIGGIAVLIEPAQTWLNEAPTRLNVVGEKLSGIRDGINDVYVVSEQLENLANGGTNEPTTTTEDQTLWQRVTSLVTTNTASQSTGDAIEPMEPIAVEVRQPRLIANLTALSSAGNFVGTLLIALVLGFFLLVEGDTLLTNTIHILPRFSDKKNAVRLVQKLETGISQYLLTITSINVGLGIVVACAMWVMGVPNAALWGLMATVLNFIPFLGALIGVVVLFLVAVFSFDSLAYASLVPLVFLTLTTIEGNFLTPMLVGRTVSLNSVAVLVSLVLWGWLWGLGGAFIGVPLLIIFKLACDQFERTAPIGELLAGR